MILTGRFVADNFNSSRSLSFNLHYYLWRLLCLFSMPMCTKTTSIVKQQLQQHMQRLKTTELCMEETDVNKTS